MLFSLMYVGEWNLLLIDRLVHTGALSSANPEADSLKIQTLDGSTHKIKLRPSTWVPNSGRQWTKRSTYCNSNIAIQSRGHYVQRKIYSRDKPYKPFDKSSIRTTQQYNTRYASGIPKFSFSSMQFENEDRTFSNVIEPILNPAKFILQSSRKTKIWVNSQIYTENEPTGKLQTSPLLESDEDLLFVQRSRQPKTTHIWSKSAIFWIIYTHERVAYSNFLVADSWTNETQ